MKTFKEIYEKGNLPDVGEMIAFEDNITINKKKFEPNTEFEVIMNDGSQIEIKKGKYKIFLSYKELVNYGYYLV